MLMVELNIMLFYYSIHRIIGVDPGKIMAELCMKDGGTCRGAGGSMHIYVSFFQVTFRPTLYSSKS